MNGCFFVIKKSVGGLRFAMTEEKGNRKREIGIQYDDEKCFRISKGGCQMFPR